MSGLVEPEDLKPNEIVGVNKDSYILLEKLPAEYDSRGIKYPLPFSPNLISQTLHF